LHPIEVREIQGTQSAVGAGAAYSNGMATGKTVFMVGC
jgi:hypothetical protein